MNLEEKLAQLRRAAHPRSRDVHLLRQLEYLRRFESTPKPLPAQRAPHPIEEYVEGVVERNERGEFFLARQSLPFGRPYGKLRIGDISTADLTPLRLLLDGAAVPSATRLAYLDTETTGLAGGTGTCAFLVGLGTIEGSQFVVRQFFIRDYPEERAMLHALAEALRSCEGLVTFNGKTFDLPLLETRFTLARMASPFTRLMHLDLLYPARLLWKLRLESCRLAHLEEQVLRVRRQGDIAGADIPGVFFDYLRTGNARGLQPVFCHNALDIVTLAALTVEISRVLADAGASSLESSLDLFGLSCILDRAGAYDEALAACRRALAAGLPPAVESQALCRLASHYKRGGQYEAAVSVWTQLAGRDDIWGVAASEELAIYYEHRKRDAAAALRIVGAALKRFREAGLLDARRERRFLHRLARLRRKTALLFCDLQSGRGSD